MNREKYVALSICVDVNRKVKKRNGRIDGLLKKLEKLANRELNRHRPTQTDVNVMVRKLDQFDKLVDWGYTDKHLVTYCSALLLMLEPFNLKQINQILIDITDYFDRMINVPPGCYWSGEVTYKKWRRVWDD